MISSMMHLLPSGRCLTACSFTSAFGFNGSVDTDVVASIESDGVIGFQ
jgi:hypothetical protein